MSELKKRRPLLDEMAIQRIAWLTVTEGLTMEQIATRLSVGVGQVEHALKSFYRKPNSGRAGKYEWQLKRLSERVKEVDKWLLQDQTLSVLSEVKGLVLSMPQQEVQELMDWIQSRVDRHDSSALAEFGRRCGFEVESSV